MMGDSELKEELPEYIPLLIYILLLFNGEEFIFYLGIL
jgi:hypothetical protein